MDEGAQAEQAGSTTTVRPPPAAVEVALVTLLQADPEALVGAIGGDLSPRLVPVPDDVPVDGHRRVEEATLLDLVPPSEQKVVAGIWGRARAQGLACAPLTTTGGDR